jgi:hypothetical protein
MICEYLLKLYLFHHLTLIRFPEHLHFFMPRELSWGHNILGHLCPSVCPHIGYSQTGLNGQLILVVTCCKQAV